VTAKSAIDFAHLFRLSDDTGLLEHARGATPRREHGYCLDDVARGLVVLGREPDPSPEMLRLTHCYVAFTTHAQSASGEFRNRLSYDRRWIDVPGTGDWWGRALWGLGTVAARIGPGWMREDAMVGFDLGATTRSRDPRARAFAVLGAGEVLDYNPDHHGARDLLSSCMAMAGRPGDDPRWPWPERRLEYANAVLAEQLLVGGEHLDDEELVEDGLQLLEWLLRMETRDGHLSVTAAGGWSPLEPRLHYDQQPIEVAALADACVRAARLTGDEGWTFGVRRAVGWFTGDNDLGVPMIDVGTGGGFDGLGQSAASTNQGAESTLALLSTLQHARDVPAIEWDGEWANSAD
jgi:hypothetical protein